MERRKKSNSGASQKACLFKIDNELLDWLDKQPNKGRYVNELIKRDMQAGDSVGYTAAVEAEARRLVCRRQAGRLTPVLCESTESGC